MPPNLTRLLILTVALCLAAVAGVAGPPATHPIFAERAKDQFLKAQMQFQSDPHNPTNAWWFARATFDYCEFATNETQHADLARLGIAACREFITREPQSAPAHYYLAMNLGELAQAEAPSLAAYRLVHEVEHEFKTAAELDVHFDHAGPARTLGELYFQAPGWPLSVGSKHKAHEWLERAAALAPDYPENLLNLAEAQLKWRQLEACETTLKNLEARWPAARTNYAGVTWEADWQDWNTRRAALQADFQKVHRHAPGL